MSIEKIPFIISVTGHRDLLQNEINIYRKQIESVLTYFCELEILKYTPIWVFSSLAEGADRLVSEVAISLRDNSNYDIRIIAPLPLDRDIYEQDFTDESSIHEFNQLLQKVNESFVLDPYEYPGFNVSNISLPSADQRSKENNWGYTPERNAQYVNLGAFLVRHANVLLSLWDGCVYENSPGGTGEVVMAMLNKPMDWGSDEKGTAISARQELKERQVLMGGESGAVVHIPVKRQKTNDLNNKEYTIVKLGDKQKPDWISFNNNEEIKWYFTNDSVHKNSVSGLIQSSQNELLSVINKINQFNEEIMELSRLNKSNKLDEMLSDSRSQLEPESYKFSASVNRIINCFTISNKMALNYQSKAKKLIAMFFLSALIAVLGYEAFDVLGADNKIYGLISLSFMLMGIILFTILYAYSKSYNHKSKFHDFRVYAELMRISTYLSYLGLNRKIIELFSPDTRSVTAWLEHARRAAEYVTWDKQYNLSRNTVEDVKNIQDWWVNNQLTYFTSKIDINKKGNLWSMHKVNSYLSKFFYILGSIVILYIAVSYYMGNQSIADYVWLAVLCFGASPAVAKWGELQGYEDDAVRYNMTRDMYQWASIEIDALLNDTKSEGLSATDKLNKLESVVLELSKQAVSENIRWYIIHTSRDVSLELG